MKRIPLLLAALGVVSAAAYAAPELRVTSIGQTLAVENTSGAQNIGEAVQFVNKLGLAYEDWTFNFLARKTWSASTNEWKDTNNKVHKGFESTNHRMEIVATRSFGDYSAALKWRAQKDYDRLQVPVSYKFGMFSGNIAPGYQFNNTTGGQDAFFMDGEPLQVKLGPVQLAYFLEYVKYTGDAKGTDTAHDYKNQIRLRGTLYSTEDYRIGAEYRYQFLHDVELGNGKQGVENNRHIAILNAAYNLTENLTIDGYYQYEFNKYDEHDVAPKADDYYGELGFGWTYKF
ncbi:hypothetical protein [Fusobacterium perfoetens]|uniref:hypothetical protein n=1 Tax=Fusobacterium perfoetens TaxID=852 RepID=UPI001F238A20|nr:hypothetical protein [Fusobacterium perfoetens]MCF2611440.1 hypothetical protein [Fusobacterium perfoetens]